MRPSSCLCHLHRSQIGQDSTIYVENLNSCQHFLGCRHHSFLLWPLGGGAPRSLFNGPGHSLLLSSGPVLQSLRREEWMLIRPHLYPSLSKNSPQGVCVEWACEQLGNTCTLTSLILREKHVSSEPLALR